MLETRTLKELVTYKGVASLLYYSCGTLVYDLDGFKFPVPIDDTGTGMFAARMKPLTMMRWIRKQLEAHKIADDLFQAQKAKQNEH